MNTLREACEAIAAAALEVTNATYDEQQDVMFFGALERLSKANISLRAALAAEGQGAELWGNFEEAIAAACKRETLAEALTVLAVWESERIVKQALANPTWETCFGFLFNHLLAAWGDRPLYRAPPPAGGEEALTKAHEACIQARGALRLDVMLDDETGKPYGTTSVALEDLDGAIRAMEGYFASRVDRGPP